MSGRLDETVKAPFWPASTLARCTTSLLCAGTEMVTVRVFEPETRRSCTFAAALELVFRMDNCAADAPWAAVVVC